MQNNSAPYASKDLLVPVKKTLSSQDMSLPTMPSKTPFNRKNLSLIGLRKWVKFDKNGETSIIQVDKHVLTHQLGVQVRHYWLIPDHGAHWRCNCNNNAY